MTGVTDFSWQIGASDLSWTYDGGRVRTHYFRPIVSAVVLRGSDGVAVVEPEDRADGKNAVVFNADGTERYRLERPCRAYDRCHFAQIHDVRDELTAFLVVQGTDFACVVDPATGACRTRYPTP